MKDHVILFHREKETFRTKQQIADTYKICVRTLNRKLEEHGIILPRGLVSPMDFQRITDVLGKAE